VSSGEQNTLTVTATRSVGMYISGFIIAASESGVQVVVKTKLIEHSK